MKDIRPVLRTFLLGDPIVSGLVGGVRIHPNRLPQDQVEPTIVINRISEVGDYNMDGDSGLGNVRMQVDAWAQTADFANELANAVYDRLSGFRGTVVANSDAIDIQGVFLAQGRDDYDDVTQLSRVSRDFTIWYVAL
jgi:hypothetical protein